ncbi:hypothetical protein AB832_07655 [Flavobacteriaceae bacterium (ex Bugula neritina AB1)]|nr:hypothetical protein AB832_07655 [Flavobacteriaceae bacterium (ex Bugula neritina AB1)]
MTTHENNRLTLISRNAINENGISIYSYVTSDTLTMVKADGYFDKQLPEHALKVNDLIYVSIDGTTDGFGLLRVLTVDMTASDQVTVENRTPAVVTP